MQKKLFNFLSVTIITISVFLSFNIFAKTEVKHYNGLRYIIYNSTDSSEIEVINVLIRAGSIFDEKGKYGEAFLVSRLLKQGGTKHFSTDSLLNKLDETGIELSTSCSKDFISVYLKFVKKERAEALNILEEILCFPSFDKREFLSVKRETVSMITAYQNNNDYIAIHQGAVTLFKNGEYAHSSFGDIKDMKKITLSDVKGFYKKFFVPENIIITFAGNFDKKEVNDFIHRNFSLKKSSYSGKEIYPKFNNVNKKIFKEKNLKQSYIYFLFPSCGLKSEDYYPVKLLSFILGGNLTSILAEKIRKEKGLAYSVFSTNYTMVNGGFFLIGMQTENSKAEEAVKTVINILKSLKINGLGQNRIKLAKNYVSGSMLISLQSLSSIAANVSRGIFTGKPIPPWTYDIKKISAVTDESLNGVIKKIFNFNRMIISIVGKK